MENSRCKAFIECVNCGSIKAAADLMGYTPSAVSQLITAFEKELGLKLFVRTQKGVELTNPSGEALDIECGKRINLELAQGMINTLCDGESGNQKAALYCKGHLEISKGGQLTVTGKKKHAIASKEYTEIKKTCGNIIIDSALGDGIHAGQYFQMNGGAVNISGVTGDGIQAEATTNITDENNGQLIVKGGTLDISFTGNDVSALKCDSLLTVSSGKITITARSQWPATYAPAADTLTIESIPYKGRMCGYRFWGMLSIWYPHLYI